MNWYAPPTTTSADSQLLTERIGELRSLLWLRLFCAFLLTLPIYLLSLVAFALLLRHANAAWLALIPLTMLVGVAGFEQLRRHRIEMRRLRTPFSSVTSCGHVLNEKSKQLAGVAHVINALVVGTVTQLITIVRNRRLAALLASLPGPDVDGLVAELRKRGTTPRFHPISEFENGFLVMNPLIAAGVVWAKLAEDGQVLIGLNRRYDHAPGFTEDVQN